MTEPASVTDLTEWRRSRSEARAIRSGHPSVAGGPNADLLAMIVRSLVPLGYRAGLWQGSARGKAHVIRSMPGAPGYAATRCGRTITPRRADPTVALCAACFPS